MSSQPPLGPTAPQSPLGSAPPLAPGDAQRPGLFTERTALAWTRTALVACVLGGVLAHAGATQNGPRSAVSWVMAGATFAFAAAVWLQGASMYTRSRARLVAGEAVARPVVLRWTSLGVAALALGTVIAAVV
jgi:uncharacterized membrane protein YidH (DUF202 family)